MKTNGMTEDFCIYYTNLTSDQRKVGYFLSLDLLLTDRVAFQKYDDEATKLVRPLLPMLLSLPF